jgi:hypothetical protein
MTTMLLLFSCLLHHTRYKQSRSTSPLLCGSDRHCSCSSQLLALIALLIRALCTVLLLQRIMDLHTDNPVPLRRFTLMPTQINHVREPAPVPERDATSERASERERRRSNRRRSSCAGKAGDDVQALRRSDAQTEEASCQVTGISAFHLSPQITTQMPWPPPHPSPPRSVSFGNYVCVIAKVAMIHRRV